MGAGREDAVAAAEAVRRGERTPAELVEEAIGRIEAVDDQLGAVIHRFFDRARAEAAEVGAALPAGPFRGVPLLVKDALCHTAGDPYHLGMRLLRDRGWTEPDDTYLAARFRRAGFVIVGKTNTPELATAYTTEPAAYGPTRNPWDTSRTAGGSSGGSAAAVASGMVAIAHGNDMGGSIRVPASACGLVGLKPSRGRTSLGPDFGDYWAMLAHEGVLTRSVRDTAAALDAIAGPAPGDPVSPPAPARPFRAEVGADPGRLRIGLRTRVPVAGTPAHPDCVAAVEVAARTLEACGHRVEEVGMPALDDDELGEHFVDVFAAAIARDLHRWSVRLDQPIGPDDVEPRNWMLAERGREVDAVRYIASVEHLQAYARRVSQWWTTGFDLLVTPTLPDPPRPLGWLGWEPDLAAVADTGQFTASFNVTGQPAVSLPLHQTDAGLPVGVQLVAAYGREDLLLRVAAQLEAAAPWAARRPAVWATP
ncbi:MAG TPA: amidase [Actinomycetes bacterium]|nr:amidase [Actinomycetes bacterium]